MLSFIPSLLLTLFSGLLAIIFFILAYRKAEDENNPKDLKDSKYTKLASIISAIFALIVGINNNVPCPEIYLVKNELNDYTNQMEIEISCEKFPLLEVYYTLDKTNPENGIKYQETFLISKDTTIYAKTKFLYWWSELSENSFGFEKINTTNKIPDHSDAQGDIQIIEPNLNFDNDINNSEQSSETESVIISKADSETEIVTSEENTEKTSSNQGQELTNINEGQNTSEAYNLLTYINQFRIEAGVGELSWDSNMEQAAQNNASNAANFGRPMESDGSYYSIGRRCNGAKNAQRAVSDWIYGNAYVVSEKEQLLNSNYTQMGGALFYLTNGDEYGYHYFWVVCLR